MNKGNNQNNTTTANQDAIVKIVPGAGKQPIEVKWHPNLTYNDALKAAGVTLQEGEVLVVGETALRKLDTKMPAGQMAVVDQKPSNG